MAERATAEDIARVAGVSTATVSRVLNHPLRVAERTRASVYEAMRTLNYSPRTVHRDVTSLTRILAFIAPNLDLDSTNEYLRAFENAIASTRFDVLLVNMRGQRNLAIFLTENSRILRKVDGAVVVSADVPEEAVRFMAGAGVPMVLLQTRSASVRSVSNNNFRGGQDAAAHLLDFGYRDIAFVGWEPRDDHVLERLSGWRAALSRENLAPPAARIAFGALSTDGGYDATRRLLAIGRPRAVFYASDALAVGGLRYLREMEIRVPEDIGVVGFDDLQIAEAIGLTTMRQHFDAKAKMAAEYLLARVSGEIRHDQPEEIQVAPRLVVRQTTRRVQEPTTACTGGEYVVRRIRDESIQ